MIISEAEERTQSNPLAVSLGALTLWLTITSVTAFLAWSARNTSARSFDFHAFYTAGKIMLTNSTHLYDVSVQHQMQAKLFGADSGNKVLFYHPSYEALLYSGLAVFSYRAAYVLYLVWNALVLLLFYCIAPRGNSPLARVVQPLLIFASVPVVICMVTGQNSLLYLVLLGFVYRYLERQQDEFAGTLLAFGLFKPSITIPMAIVLSAWKGRRFLTSFLLCGIAVLSLCVALSGPKSLLELTRLLMHSSASFGNATDPNAIISVYPREMPNLAGLLYILGTSHLPALSAMLVNALADAVLLLAAIYRIRRPGGGGEQVDASTAFSIAVCCALLLSQHLYIYDFSLIVFPVLLLRSRVQTLLVILSCAVPLILLIATGVQWFAIAAPLPLMFLGSTLSEPKELRC